MLVYNESIDLNSKIRFIRVPCGSELTSHSQSRTQTVSILCIWPILKRLYFIFHRGSYIRSPEVLVFDFESNFRRAVVEGPVLQRKYASSFLLFSTT